LLAGDSIACSLQPGLDEVGRAAGFPVSTAAVIGCGIASGVVDSNEVQVPTGTTACPDLMGNTLRTALRQHRPDVVLWLSTWERVDLVEGGRTLRAGTKEWERAMLRRMDRVLARLTATGARVVVATVASTAPAKLHVNVDESAQTRQDESYARLNHLLTRFAARHPDDVTLVDLAAQVCPGGPPCPERVDGVTLRPSDGGHFSPEGGVWASERLLPALEQTLGKPPAGT